MSADASPALRDAVIADDVMVNRKVLESQLAKLGFSCRHAANGREAVAACRKRMPEVLFLDVIMPEMDGFEAAEAVRSLPGGERLPIILLTGLESDEVRAQADAMDVHAVLTKPVRPLSVRAVVRGIATPVAAAASPSPGQVGEPVRRVLIVDDSALMRKLLADLLGRSPGLEIVATARDADGAWEAIQRHAPDVLTLDVEMPGMDGLTFLGRLMRLRPMPVVMVSSLTARDSETTVRALELGAVDYVAKPKGRLREGLAAMADEIVAKVRTAACARVRPPRVEAIQPARSDGYDFTDRRLIVVGASTGGPKALAELLEALPPRCPPIVIVQHMPSAFTRSFARRLDQRCALTVQQPEGDTPLRAGQVLVAPGDAHLRLEARQGRVWARLDESPPVNRHRPSVDVLFRSAAALPHAELIAVLLTGMGADGADGLLEIRRHGGQTIAQDKASSVVYGMPRAAVERGAAEHVLALERIPQALVKLSARDQRRRA